MRGFDPRGASSNLAGSFKKMMETKMQKIGNISRPLSLAPYLSYLRERLADEDKGVVRKYIRAKLRHVTGKKK